MAWPSMKMRYPSDVRPEQNGLLRPEQLQPVMAPGWGMITLHPHAARAFNALQFFCWLATNQQISVASPADGYRIFAVQESVFFQRFWRVMSTLVRRVYKGVVYWKKPIVAQVATPGTSNHGWGLAFDAAWWVEVSPGKWKIMGITRNKQAFAWLTENAPLYGFYWNVKSEAWHLEYCTGDSIPQKVLDFEAWKQSVGLA